MKKKFFNFTDLYWGQHDPRNYSRTSDVANKKKRENILTKAGDTFMSAIGFPKPISSQTG